MKLKLSFSSFSTEAVSSELELEADSNSSCWSWWSKPKRLLQCCTILALLSSLFLKRRTESTKIRLTWWNSLQRLKPFFPNCRRACCQNKLATPMSIALKAAAFKPLQGASNSIVLIRFHKRDLIHTKSGVLCWVFDWVGKMIGKIIWRRFTVKDGKDDALMWCSCASLDKIRLCSFYITKIWQSSPSSMKGHFQWSYLVQYDLSLSIFWGKHYFDWLWHRTARSWWMRWW